MKVVRIFAACVVLFSLRAAAQNGPFEVRFSLTATTILLGEPVWINIIATNRSDHNLKLGWVGDCFDTRQIVVNVPEARQVGGPPIHCDGRGGSCMTPFPTALRPGESESRRYVLAGNFRVVQPGTYTVNVRKTLHYALGGFETDKSSLPINSGFPKEWFEQVATWKTALKVLPPDPVQLLAIEQALAAEVATPIPRTPFPAFSNHEDEAYEKVMQVWREEDMHSRETSLELRWALKEGLGTYPAAGMEGVYATADYGIAALKTLNTPRAREILAQMAVPAPDRFVNGVKQPNNRWAAVNALGYMGDTAYLPQLEKYATDDDRQVRQSAIFALSRLGGPAELPVLNRLAHNGTILYDRSEAVIAIGRMGLAEAVPYLLDLFELKDSDQPSASDYGLMSTTHHQLPPLGRLRTIAETEAEWRTWWRQHRAIAKIFTYDEDRCRETYDQ